LWILKAITCPSNPSLAAKVHSVLSMAIATTTPLSLAYAALAKKGQETKVSKGDELKPLVPRRDGEEDVGGKGKRELDQ
jgi:hypothetical protein